VIALIAALALAGDPSIKPWPIGPGAAYVPSAGRVAAHETCASAGTFLVHLELFADRKAIVIPAGIGACTDAVRTRTPMGIVEVSRGKPRTVADLFRVWGRPLGSHRLLSFRSRSPVRGYVNGRRAAGPVGAIPLTEGAQIVLQIGGYVPPHRYFLFPRGSS
jgi:hypothetical protein